MQRKGKKLLKFDSAFQISVRASSKNPPKGETSKLGVLVGFESLTQSIRSSNTSY